MIQRYTRNKKGRDFAIGDIHGCFQRLRGLLNEAGFDPAVDRLFSVGDLVDRGDDSEQVLSWLALPWFHAVRGNHEDTAIRYAAKKSVNIAMYSANGGDWFMALTPERQQLFAAAFEQLPLAIEVETVNGLVGIVHADCPLADWGEFRALLESLGDSVQQQDREPCMWSRHRITAMDRTEVAGIRAVVVGHTPLEQPVILGNVYHIDTGGWMETGRFSLLNLDLLNIKAYA
ncbi:metallophosphoesterase [Alcaligenaceae bacterium]|nr:metallophosphoesterase [Alcaligenaceae bacterium]